MSRRLSLHDVKLPPNLLKDVGIDRMVKLNGDDDAFLEYFDGLDLEDVRQGVILIGSGGGEGSSERIVAMPALQDCLYSILNYVVWYIYTAPHSPNIHAHIHTQYINTGDIAHVSTQLKSAQTKRQDLSDVILQVAVINCDKETAFEERKTQLRLKLLQMVDQKNEYNKKYEELSELDTIWADPTIP